MTTTVLSPRRLNRALLARQHLLRRSTASLPALLESVGGLQMQYAPSGYIGVWSRLADVTRDRVTRALERRQVVQATLLRGTIHLTSPADHVAMAAGAMPAMREWWLAGARRRGLPEVDHDALAATIRGWFADGPLEHREVMARLDDVGIDRGHWEGLRLWVDLVRLPPQGTWDRRRAHRYGLAGVELDQPPVDHRAGLVRLVEAYLGGFGPAAVEDLSSWAQVPVGAFEEVLADLPLRTFADADGRRLVDLPRRPLPPADVPAPVRFLGTWDATLLAHARRTQILPADVRDRVFDVRMPHSVNTVLVDGQVAGTWTWGHAGTPGRVDVEWFDGPPRGRLAEGLAEESAGLQAFVA